MRRKPPTLLEMQALMRISGGDDVEVLCRYCVMNEATFFAVERVRVEEGAVVEAQSGEWTADAWCGLDHDGPMPWEELARRVAKLEERR